MFSKILVGTDGSETASVAVAHAGGLTARLGAELILVSAFPAAAETQSTLGPAETDTRDDVARSVLQHEARRLGEGVNVRTVAQAGNPADVILDVAEEEGVDLIVVGNRGMTRAKRFLLGSVPNNVSHHAPCHVLIVHTMWAEKADPDQQATERLYERILIGTDGSATARKAVRIGADLAAAVGADVLLLSVGEPDWGREIVQAAAAEIGDRAPVSLNTAVGDPAEQLIDTAVREGCDLIVVGNKGMTGARRFLMGSVPNNVSHHAETNVLIAKTT